MLQHYQHYTTTTTNQHTIKPPTAGMGLSDPPATETFPRRRSFYSAITESTDVWINFHALLVVPLWTPPSRSRTTIPPWVTRFLVRVASSTLTILTATGNTVLPAKLVIDSARFDHARGDRYARVPPRTHNFQGRQTHTWISSARKRRDEKSEQIWQQLWRGAQFMMIGFGAKNTLRKVSCEKKSRNRKILRLIWMVVAVRLDFFSQEREGWKPSKRNTGKVDISRKRRNQDKSRTA